MTKQQICIGAFIVGIIGVVVAGPSTFAFAMVATFFLVAIYQPVSALLRPVLENAVETALPPVPDDPSETEELKRKLFNHGE